jgi:tetratricopeptide (TPR) repeat protein
MRWILAVLVLGLAASGQITPKRIPPDEAEKHLINKVPASYPPLAEAGRIQGDIILEVSIDEAGVTRVRRVIMGHPMLVQAAVDSANWWRYQPFEVDGKPAVVITLIMVTIGKAGKENEAAARAAMLFQDKFWTAEESAEAALRRGDYAATELQLNTARNILAPESDGGRHGSERWQWMISEGRLAMARQKYGEAEQYYRKALDLRQEGDKDAPEMAITLADLGGLYAEQKRYDPAREYASRSIAIYQKNLKRVGSKNAGAREVYGRAIAYQSWMLSKIALQQNDHIEAGKQCRVVLDFQTFLVAADHDSLVSACEQAIKDPAPKE